MTKVKMSSLYILFGNALLSVIHLVEAEISTDWNTGDGGFNWRTNCDFPGDDIGHIPLTIATREKCGRLCIANPQCSHFVFGYLENCYMKNAPSMPPRQDIDYESIAICGIIPWRFGSEPVSDDWKSISGSGAHSCGFYGNNSLILTAECRQAQDCSFWYEQVPPTEGSSACKLVDGSFGSCCPQLPKTPEFPQETQYITMIPDERKRIIEAGTTLTLTCVYAFEDENQRNAYNFSWEIPNYLTKNAELSDLDNRLRKTFGRNETHMTSTLSLANARARDTGDFLCKGIPVGYKSIFTVNQYVYVFNDTELVILDANEFYIVIPHGETNYPIKCIPTHPDVNVSLIFEQQFTAIAKNIMEPKTDLISDPNSNWSFEKRKGLKLKKAKIDDNGKFSCIGTYNNKKTSSLYSDFFLFVPGMELTRSDGEDDPFEGSNVTLGCRTYQYTKNSYPPKWSYQINRNGQMQIIDEINPPEGIEITSEKFDYEGKTLYENQLYIFDISPNAYTFQCQGSEFTENISFRSKELNGDSKLKTVQLEKDVAQNLTCFKGSQNARIKWFKDGKEYSGQFYSDDTSSILPLQGKMGENGSYACQWKVSFPGDVKFRNFTVSDIDRVSENDKTVVIAVSTTFAVLLLVIFIGLMIFAGVKFYYDKKRRVSQEALIKLLNGNANQINNQSPIEDQIEFLPYDRRWEFPRHRLKLGVQLGAGCFGRVVKAEAVGLKKGSEETVKTVAVKMVRSEANVSAMEALISELKILVYLGSHLNVVNLLGACTKQIHKGELLVIVECCRFGNLQTFLINHRTNFFNLVDEFGNLKMQDEMESNNFTRSEIPSQVETSELQPDDHPGVNSSSEILDISNSNLQDFDGNFYRPISTTDLISWAFQIARGMDYLVSKKVLHGDLAARNILLADDGIVKVADFGMAKKMYYEENYEKGGQGLMPVKWMAIESLIDRIFSCQSDVWSYGVVLWEIFSLGRVPYPGMDVGHILMKEILKGYRMDKPELAPNFFGEMMADCWKSDPKERPTFSQMEEIICSHMESSVSSDYLNMNAPYAKLNQEKENATPKDQFGLAKLLKEKSGTKSKKYATPRNSMFPMRSSKKVADSDL